MLGLTSPGRNNANDKKKKNRNIHVLFIDEVDQMTFNCNYYN